MADAPASGIRSVRIVNAKGLHARASAKFVQTAGRFDAQVTVHTDGHSVTGTSIMGLMMLGAGIGSELGLSAEGPQAREALDALQALIEARFGEDS
ncbi:MAG: HPr family phosphocarrier protein [Phycisphaerae bacterium]